MEFPQNILAEICTFIDSTKEIVNVFCISKQWYSVDKDPYFWNALCKRDYNVQGSKSKYVAHHRKTQLMSRLRPFRLKQENDTLYSWKELRDYVKKSMLLPSGNRCTDYAIISCDLLGVMKETGILGTQAAVATQQIMAALVYSPGRLENYLGVYMHPFLFYCFTWTLGRMFDVDGVVQVIKTQEIDQSVVLSWLLWRLGLPFGDSKKNLPIVEKFHRTTHLLFEENLACSAEFIVIPCNDYANMSGFHRGNRCNSFTINNSIIVILFSIQFAQGYFSLLNL
jgi:hypothetical protein